MLEQHTRPNIMNRLRSAGRVLKALSYERRLPMRAVNSRPFCLLPFVRDQLRNARKSDAADAETIYLHLPSLHMRYLYQVLYFFSLLGRPMKLIRHITLGEYVALAQEGRLIYNLPNLKVVDQPPLLSHVRAQLFVRSATSSGMPVEGLEGDVIINTDIAQPASPAFLVMPYGAHPAQYDNGQMTRLDARRASERSVRVFFAGSTRHYEGRGSTVACLFGILPRLEALQTVRQRLPPDRLCVARTPQDRAALLHGGARSGGASKLVLATAKGTSDAWLDDLSRCDFFLCLPGISMPVAHNIIEAMAVGAIPILAYPEWFSPPLRHRHNCLVYAGADGLIEAIEQALAMSAREVSILRSRVIQYYDAHLCPKRFVERVVCCRLDPLTIYVNTEDRDVLARLHSASALFSPPLTHTDPAAD